MTAEEYTAHCAEIELCTSVPELMDKGQAFTLQAIAIGTAINERRDEYLVLVRLGDKVSRRIHDLNETLVKVVDIDPTTGSRKLRFKWSPGTEKGGRHFGGQGV